MTEQAQYWAYYEVRFHSILYDIWSELDSRMPGHYQKEMNPHVTIHPRFQFDEGEQERFKHFVYERFPRQIELEVTDFYYHPDQTRPMVVCLDVNTNIPFRDKQIRLMNDIERNNGKNVLNTSPPHVTVYKSKDKGPGFRKIPPNVNQIKTRCKKLGEEKLPITVTDTELKIERAV